MKDKTPSVVTATHPHSLGKLSRIRHLARQYAALTKPRVTQLAVFCAIIGMFLATPGMVPWRVLIGGAAAALHGATSKIHRHEGLDFDTLVDRFEAEMRSAVGDPQRIGLNFLELIERLYGELKRVSAAQRLA